MQLFPNSLLRRSVFLLIAKFNIYAICSSDKKNCYKQPENCYFLLLFPSSDETKKKCKQSMLIEFEGKKKLLQKILIDLVT